MQNGNKSLSSKENENKIRKLGKWWIKTMKIHLKYVNGNTS